MKWSSAAFLGLAASAVADQGAAVTDIVKPDSPAPGGCSASRDGKFQVSIYSLGNSKRDLQVRDPSFDIHTKTWWTDNDCSVCSETRLWW